jgi:hypothetical protein
MSDRPDPLAVEARAILETLISKPFEACISVGREFPALTTQHSIYAVRHRTEGLLYIGKSQNPKSRFTGGHKALVWCWLEGYHPDDVRIAAYPLNYTQWSQLSLSLETLIIQATEPPFNVKVPMRD